MSTREVVIIIHQILTQKTNFINNLAQTYFFFFIHF